MTPETSRPTGLPLLRLKANGPFNPDLTIRVLAAHAVPGLDLVDLRRRRYVRRIRIDGHDLLVDLTFTAAGIVAGWSSAAQPGALPGALPAAQPAARPAESFARRIAALLGRWFDLDADIAVIDAELGADTTLGAVVARTPAVRLVGYPCEFEAVVATVVGQQVSLAAASTFLGRLVVSIGSSPVCSGGLAAFPTAPEVAARSEDELQATIGLTRTRSRTVRRVAEQWADGFTLAGLGREEARSALLEVPGIGPWTADYLAVRALQDPDVFACGDLVARRALGGRSADQVRALAATWSPWRSYALFRLWADVAYLKH